MRTDSEPYIPMSRKAVIELCASTMAQSNARQFARFAEILSAWYHFVYHADLERIKESFATDSATFASDLDKIVRAANFTKIEQSDLDRALGEESVFRLRLAVDFNDFEEIVFYRRGASTQTATISQWFGLRNRTIEFTNFDHVLVYVRFTPIPFNETGEPQRFAPGNSILKLFTNVPEADLEMLFPNTQVRMRLMDKMFLGVPAFVSGMVVLSTKIGGTFLIVIGFVSFWLGMSNNAVEIDQPALIALMSAAGALGAYFWKQFSNFKNRKIRFMKALAENLYFKTLANDEGVLSYLVDRAEESDTKEVLLAYAELIANRPMTETELAQALATRLGENVAFDISDAMTKLNKLGLVQKKGHLLQPLPAEQAFERIDRLWDEAYTTH